MASSSKTLWRMEMAIRYFAKNPGATDAEIAEYIGLTPSGFATMKQSPDFKIMEKRYQTKALSELDEVLAEDTQNLRTKLRAGVPTALQYLYDVVADDKCNTKDRIRAAESIINRDGRFVEVSRTVVQTDMDTTSPINNKDKEVIDELVAVSQRPVSVKKETIQ